MPTAGSIIFYDSGGNLSEDNSNLFWDNTNKRIGIGMNNPIKQLEIFKTGSESAIQISGDTGQQQALYFKDTAARWAIYKPASSTDLRFWDGNTDRIWFLNGGKIGIGASPNRPLEIAPATPDDYPVRFRRSNAESTYGELVSGTDGVGIAARNVSSGSGLHFFVSTGESDVERMRIASDGKVGIGVTPSANILTDIRGSGSSFKHALYGEIAYAAGIAGTKIGVFGVVTGSAVGDAYGSAGVFGRTTTYTTPGSGYGVPVGTFGDCDPLGSFTNPTTTSGRNYVQYAMEADCWSTHESSAGLRAILKTDDSAGRAVWASIRDTNLVSAGKILYCSIGDGSSTEYNVFSVKGNRNVEFFGGAGDGGGVEIMTIKNAGTTPTSNPSGGGFLYAQSGAGKWRGSSGTITTFGPAEPHCPKCGYDFIHMYENFIWKARLIKCEWCGYTKKEGPETVHEFLKRRNDA